MLNGLLQMERLSSGYQRIPVLNEVSFHISEGEMVAIIGPNGAGKTTLLKKISGLIPPVSGRIIFDGKDITGYPLILSAGSGLPTCRRAGGCFPI